MKLSETLSTSRKQNGYESVRKQRRAKEVNGTEPNVRRGSGQRNEASSKDLKDEKCSKTGELRETRTEIRSRNSFSRRQAPFETGNEQDTYDSSPTRRHRSRSDYDKPWLQGSRRQSHPKSSEDLNESPKTEENVTKKPPKAPPAFLTPSVKEKAEKVKPPEGQKQFESKTTATAKKTGGQKENGNRAEAAVQVTKSSNNSNNNNNHLNTSQDTFEPRSKATLKRQLALDKTPASVHVNPSNLKESLSEESLNSINSVTQLLKIERSAYAVNNRKARQNGDDDNDEEDKDDTIFSVKNITAKLEARNKNANNLKSQDGNDIKRRNEENARRNKRIGSVDEDATSKTRSTSSLEKENKLELEGKNEGEQQKKSFSVGKGFQESKEVKGQKSTIVAGITISESSSILLKAAAAVVCSLQTERKKSTSSKISSSSALTSSSVTSKSKASTSTDPAAELDVGVVQEGKKDSSALSPPSKSSSSSTTTAATSSIVSKLNQDAINLSSRSRSRTRSSSPTKPSPSLKRDTSLRVTAAAATSPERRCSFSAEVSKEAPEKKTRGQRQSRSPTRKSTAESRRKSFAEQETKGRSPSGSRKGSLGSSSGGAGGPYSATASSLAKAKANRIRDSHHQQQQQQKREESIRRKEWRSSINNNNNNKSYLTNSITSPNHSNPSSGGTTTNTEFRGQGQRKNTTTDTSSAAQQRNRIRISEEHSSRKKTDDHHDHGNRDDDHNGNEGKRRSGNNPALPRYMSPIRSKTKEKNLDSVNNTSIFSSSTSNSFTARAASKKLPSESTTNTSSARGISNWRFGTTGRGVTEGKKTKSDVRNNNNIIKSVKESSASANTNLSSSSSASSSSSSLPSSLRRSKQSQQQQQQRQRVIIPTIIMSEYVEGEKEEKGKANSVSAKKEKCESSFIPLEFIEPLKSPRYTVEGSSLELKVRVKGAEAVVWVKEDKIIPNAPPDFHYFHEKSENLYGLRIADVFLQDTGIYVCEAYGAGGKVITSWCEVEVIETGTNEDDEDISWDDLDIMSEEAEAPHPLVVPIIVTSQAEQEQEQEKEDEESENDNEVAATSESNADFGSNAISSAAAAAAQQPSNPVEVDVKQIDNDKICEQNAEKDKSGRKEEPERDQTSVSNSSSSSKRNSFTSSTTTRSTCEETSFSHQKNRIGENNVLEAEATPAQAEEVVDDHHPIPHHHHHHRHDRIIVDTDTSVTTSQGKDSSHKTNEKRKLMSQLSSASDESIYLKEPRSGDEGALSSTEDNASASIRGLDVKNIANNEEERSAESPDPTVSSSPCSEQNGRSSSVDSAIGLLGRPLFSDGKFPPRILVGPSNIIALYGEVVHLRVKVQNYGIPKTAVNWFKFINGTYKRIEHSSVGMYQFQQQNSDSQPHILIQKDGTTLSTLTITHINYDDCGRYRVKVQNVLGMDSHDCLLTVEGPPEPPATPPKVKYDEKSKTILIQWSSCPYDGGSKITGYYVEASIVHGSKTNINKEDLDNWQLLTPQSYSWLCYTLTEPKRGSVYRFRVFGENAYGKGKPTEPSLPLSVPVMMDGRRAGSSDALLWSLKSLSQEETSLRADSSRKEVVHELENETGTLEESASSQEEEPVEYKNVKIKRGTFCDYYEKLDELGKGRFGVVFEVVNKETKKSYAGKFVKCIKAKDKERVQLEVNIMNDLQYHPKLICLIDAFEMPREIIIVTQRIDGGELFERVVADDFTLTEGDCITFLRQICDAVKYIHEKNIMHLDLKPENILCTSKNSNSIKIIDFGLAQYYDPKEPIRVLFGTAEFVSPEIINYEPIHPSTDCWSVGVITYILLSGLSPFMGDNDNETFSNITRAEFDFDDEAFEKISDDAKDFISNLIVKRPEKRMTAEQCLEHHWLKRESDKIKTDVILSTDKLKRFLVRRKWQKTGNAIRALGRITTLYSSRRSSSASSTPTGSLSISSPPIPSSPFSPSRSGSLATHDSSDLDNVFFSHSSADSFNTKTSGSPNININNNNVSPASPRLTKHVQLRVTKEHPLISRPVTIPTASDSSSVKTKYSDPSRSDSGVCDVGSFSSSLSYDA